MYVTWQKENLKEQTLRSRDQATMLQSVLEKVRRIAAACSLDLLSTKKCRRKGTRTRLKADKRSQTSPMNEK